jgi:hypothetical protein
MSRNLTSASDIPEFQSWASSSVDSISLHSSLLVSFSLTDLYSKLRPGGSLTIENPEANTKKSLLFAGFCKVSESPSSITSSKPTTTVPSELKAEWQKALSGQDQIDEDDLLEDDEEYKTLASAEDCLTRAKPCKNCTCGRADELKKQNQAVELSSSCGRCHLGDAFRCAGCPFRGTPAFVPGQKVESDIGLVVSEGAAKIQAGKVRLEL